MLKKHSKKIWLGVLAIAAMGVIALLFIHRPVVAPSGTSGSGIRGQAVMAPSCVGPCQDGQLHSPQPYHHSYTVFVTHAVSKNSGAGSQALIAKATADANGAFTVNLPAGDYMLEFETGQSGPPAAAPQRVTVLDGQYTNITVTFQSGIY